MIADVPEAVQRALRPGEHVEWCGRPRQGVFLRGFDALYLITGGLAAAFGTGTLFMFARNAGSVTPVLFGSVFFVFGHYIWWGRFLVDRAVRAGLYYAITDHRCVIVGTRFRRIVRSFPRRHAGFHLDLLGNGLGTIWIDPAMRYSSSRSMYHWFSCFEQITEASVVFELVKDLATHPPTRAVQIDPGLNDTRF